MRQLATHISLRLHTWAGWIGDMSYITDYLLRKSWYSPWWIPKAFNAMLRGVGAVTFASNPITGILIVIALFSANVNVALGCVLGAVIGLIFSKILKYPERLISDGVPILNNVLLGCISTSLYPSVIGKEIDAEFWGYLTFALIATMYLDKGLNALLASASLPAYSIPFNIAITILLLCLHEPPTQSLFLSYTIHDANTTQEVEWEKVMKGTLLSVGQVYGVDTVLSSSLIYLAFFLYSPCLTLFLYLGSLIGTLTGVLLSSVPYTNVYSGLWGYNGLLTSGAISFFLVPTPSVALAAGLGAALATAIQGAILNAFAPTEIPVISYPFNIVTVSLTAIANTPGSPFHTVVKPSFPEKHLIQYYKSIKRNKPADEINFDLDEHKNDP